jgi:hypothetical protein
MLLVELVFEAAEGSLAPDRTCQPAPGTFICYPIGEVGHVLVPDPGRQRVDDDQVQLVEVDRRLAVDAGVSCPERDLSRVGLISQWCSQSVWLASAFAICSGSMLLRSSTRPG